MNHYHANRFEDFLIKSIYVSLKAKAYGKVIALTQKCVFFTRAEGYKVATWLES